MQYMTIGQLATRAGVNVQTVRYYERRGLVHPAARRQSGYREFAPDDVRRIHFVKGAQQLGFTLKEIADLLALRVESTRACGQVQTQAEGKIAEIDLKLRGLRQMKRTLQHLVGDCKRREQTDACPVLAAFDGAST